MWVSLKVLWGWSFTEPMENSPLTLLLLFFPFIADKAGMFASAECIINASSSGVGQRLRFDALNYSGDSWPEVTFNLWSQKKVLG